MKIKKNITITTILLTTIIATHGISFSKENNQSFSETTIEFDEDFLDYNQIETEIDKVLFDSYPSPTTPPTPSSISLSENIIIEDNRHLVALTFDDGPSAYTEDLLKLLNEYDVKATFFVLEYNCEKYPDTLSLITKYGNELAIHGATHTSFTKLTTDEVNNEIISTIDYIESLGVETTDLVRPPYGSLNNNIKDNVPYSFILWTIDTEDWKTKDKDKIKQTILENIQETAIILMHDTKSVHKPDLEALQEILPELTKEYKFVTVSELFEYYDINLEDGKTYRKIKSEN